MRSLHRSVCKSAEIPQAQPMDALGGGHYLTHPIAFSDPISMSPTLTITRRSYKVSSPR